MVKSETIFNFVQEDYFKKVFDWHFHDEINILYLYTHIFSSFEKCAQKSIFFESLQMIIPAGINIGTINSIDVSFREAFGLS